jgi:predicted transglutaminase-like cysteine proteinase
MLKPILLATCFLFSPAIVKGEEYNNVIFPPVGYIQFCDDNKRECLNYDTLADPIVLEQNTHSAIYEINNDVNALIEQISDKELFGVEEFWTFPFQNKGDCEDIALAKRNLLVEAGLPKNRLPLTVVYNKEKNELHTVLLIDSTEGMFILDSLTDEIWAIEESNYIFIKRLSDQHIRKWEPMISQEKYNEILKGLKT